MAKAKLAEGDILPDGEQSFEDGRRASDIARAFFNLAEFYGFRRVFMRGLEEAKSFHPVARQGFLDERPLVIAKLKTGHDVAIFPPSLLTLLRRYGAQKWYDLPHPLKMSFGETVVSMIPGSRNGSMRMDRDWGLCMIEEKGPVAEAEMMLILWKTLEALSFPLAQVAIHVGVTSCPECRPSYRSQLASFLRGRAGRLCKNCRKNLKKAPTKVFSCRDEKCRQALARAPQVLDFLCEICKKHLRGFLEFLDEMQIPYLLDPKLFREGSLYGVFLFELVYPLAVSEPAGAPAEEVVIAEGGRFAKVAELMTGRKLDGVVVAIRGNALMRVMREVRMPFVTSGAPRVFLTHLGDLAKRKSLGLMEILRAAGIEVEESLGRDSIKSQLKIAEREAALLALVFGQKEALDRTIIVRELDSGIQETIPQDKMIDFLKRKFAKKE